MTRSERGTFLGDFFGGHGGVAKAAQRRNVRGRVWDIRRGSQFDLLKSSTQRTIVQEADARRLVGAMLAPPCNTFSIAQSGRLRTIHEPWGRSDLSDELQSKVILGNRLARRALRLARVFHARNIPWILEHPSTSYLWHTPEIAAMLRLHKVEMVTIDQCAFGSAHRKRTTFLCGHCDEHDLWLLADRRCCSCTGVCDFSGRKHIQLSGGSKTAQSQVYPPALCRKLADLLLHAVLHRRTI